MAVTKQTYTAAANWTASGFAGAMRSAFIGANLMAEWYDSFLSGSIENRILEINYQGSKNYGKCYYWFMFTATEFKVAMASGWNATTHVPTGTQYVDYFSTSTNTLTGHTSIASSLVAATQLDIIRYTSAQNSNYSWFVLRNGAAPSPFFIAPASATIVSWLDLNKFLFHHFVAPRYKHSPSSANDMAGVTFTDYYRIGRSYRDTGWIKGAAGDYNYYATQNHPLLSYRCLSDALNGSGVTATDPVIHVPYGFSGVNPAFGSNYTPVVNGYSYSPYVLQPMPSDFGFQFSFLSSAFSFADRVVVTPGTEEWEVIDYRNNNTTTSGSPLLLARVV